MCLPSSFEFTSPVIYNDTSLALNLPVECDFQLSLHHRASPTLLNLELSRISIQYVFDVIRAHLLFEQKPFLW